jgi:hypothetical protein
MSISTTTTTSEKISSHCAGRQTGSSRQGDEEKVSLENFEVFKKLKNKVSFCVLLFFKLVMYVI